MEWTLSERQRDQLRSGAAVWHIRLSHRQLEQFDMLARLLAQANQQFNLTRIKQEQVVTLHFLDSLAFAACHSLADGTRIADVGTGAGFPGLPLAIAFPEARMTLVDGTGKRVQFVTSVIAAAGITNCRTVHARAEEMSRRPGERGRYDVVVARAVAPLDRLAPWLLPLVRPGGIAVAYKGPLVEAEMESARETVTRLYGAFERPCRLTLPETDIVRNLITMRVDRPEGCNAPLLQPAPPIKRRIP